MEFCKTRCQQKIWAKTAIAVIIVIVLICSIFQHKTVEEEVNTCQPTISVRKMGQFGNQIWEYMSLYAIWQMNYKLLEDRHLIPYIDEDLKTSLEDLFENLTIPAFPKIYHHCYDKETIVIPKEKSFRLPEDMSRRNVLLDNYSARFKDVIKFGVDNIKKEVRFKQHYVEDVWKTLDRIRKEKNLQNNETTFIGLHYRGGDYVPHLEGHHGDKFKGPPNYTYYTSAMDYFKARYSNIIFILVSIDQDWLKDNAEKILNHSLVVMNPFMKDRNRDLTLLSYCNHSVINYGTFGVTAALFAQGETVVYDLGIPIDYRGDTIALALSNLLPNWMAMNNTCLNCA